MVRYYKIRLVLYATAVMDTFHLYMMMISHNISQENVLNVTPTRSPTRATLVARSNVLGALRTGCQIQEDLAANVNMASKMTARPRANARRRTTSRRAQHR